MLTASQSDFPTSGLGARSFMSQERTARIYPRRESAPWLRPDRAFRI